MNVGQWMRAALAGAAIAAIAPARAIAQPAATATAPASQPAPTTPELDLKQYLDRLSASLTQGPPPQRDEAAQRLVEIDSTHTTIKNTLLGNDDRAQNACAKAIADGRTLDRDWLSPLVDMLSKDRTVDAAARALVRYDTEPLAYGPLINIARLRQQADREAIVKDLGQVVQKPVAEALVGLVTDTTESTAIRDAAAEALAQLSGQTGYGTNPRTWQAWLNARQAKDPADWRAQVLAEQHATLQHDRASGHDQLQQFKIGVFDQFQKQYDRVAPAERTKMLLSLLNDTDANLRTIGARLVQHGVGVGQPITDEIHARLIDLIGDASPDVRNQIASLLRDLAEPNALDAILVQLQVETETGVKINLLRAFAPQKNAKAKAVPIVVRLLQDPSLHVAAEAAGALNAMAGEIGNDVALGGQVFQDLTAVLQTRTGPPGMPRDEPGSNELRTALVAAMATFAAADRVDAMDVFPQLLNPNESPPVRREAVRGLIPLGERSAEIIAQELSVNNEPDPGVRREAAIALGQIGSFSYAQRLFDSTQSQIEPDRPVREAAWTAFQALLQAPATTLQELYTWADIFHQQKDPDHLNRELIVRKQIEQKQRAARKLEALAVERQRIGEIYLDLSPAQDAEAVPALRDALNYWEQNHANNQTVVRLVRELMKALLQSGQFTAAIRFGEQEIRRDRSNQDEIGPLIRNTVEDLVKKGDATSLHDAAALIGDALAMDPPLDVTYRDALQTAKQGLPPGSPGS